MFILSYLVNLCDSFESLIQAAFFLTRTQNGKVYYKVRWQSYTWEEDAEVRGSDLDTMLKDWETVNGVTVVPQPVRPTYVTEPLVRGHLFIHTLLIEDMARCGYLS